MINGTEYAFEDVAIRILGRSIIGFVDFSYGATKDYKNIHGRGNRPIKRGRGKKDAKPAKLSILQSEFEAMQRMSLPGIDPTDWPPFSITVAYAPLFGQITVDTIPYCQITDWEKGMTTDDGNMTIVLNMITDIPILNV